ncbi:hypothetical protein [Haloferula sp. BvORR071]|uniref:hypothetical protein n=1 Tax=Haloferula sp. BvORR071 TaxID=1396141 RepID=UPI00054E2F75|nr:hypothetical protein [Haloferula sp. BvORR071]
MKALPTVRHASHPPAGLEEAVAIYRSFWSERGLNSKGWNVHFDGSEADLQALYYCVYELGFPDDDYRLAALIWAQAMVHLTEIRWLEPIAGQFAIGGPTDGYPRLVFFPHTRLLEIAKGSHTQFDVFAFLTDSLLLQALRAEHEPSEIPKLCALSFGQDYYSGAGSSFHPLAVLTRWLSRSAARAEKIQAAADQLAREEFVKQLGEDMGAS